jgi:Raf kinase inhibitor-like YbhB/YbcL family protein
MQITRIFTSFMLTSLFIITPVGAGGSMAFVIQSSVFQPSGTIPGQYTCEGEDISPPLTWSGVPKETRSLVLIVDDPDAPDPAAPRMTWVHWLVYNLPPDSGGLLEGVSEEGLPEGTRLGRNDFKRIRFGGPCPPIGKHRYFFKLYALDTLLPDMGKPDKPALLKAMEGHVLGETKLMGTYEKQR